MARDKNPDSMRTSDPKEDFRSELDLVELLDQDTVEKSKAKVFPVTALIRGDKIDSRRPRDRSGDSGASRTNAAASGPYPGAGRCHGPQKRRIHFDHGTWSATPLSSRAKTKKAHSLVASWTWSSGTRSHAWSMWRYIRKIPAGALRMELVYLYGFCACGFITGIICA